MVPLLLLLLRGQTIASRRACAASSEKCDSTEGPTPPGQDIVYSLYLNRKGCSDALSLSKQISEGQRQREGLNGARKGALQAEANPFE